jgi:hypothetical protein
MVKHIAIGSRPVADPGAQSWVQHGDGAAEVAAAARRVVYTARLTIDVTPELRGRIKIVAFRRGVTVADMLRELLEREFPAKEGDA